MMYGRQHSFAAALFNFEVILRPNFGQLRHTILDTLIVLNEGIYMQRTVVKVYGVLIALLAATGLVNDGHLLGIMNVDPMLDWLRVGLAVFLLYVGFGAKSERIVRGSLWFVGLVYIGTGALGLLNTTMWAVLPSGLTGFDAAFHLVAGLLAIAVTAKKETKDGNSLRA